MSESFIYTVAMQLIIIGVAWGTVKTTLNGTKKRVDSCESRCESLERCNADQNTKIVAVEKDIGYIRETVTHIRDKIGG